MLKWNAFASGEIAENSLSLSPPFSYVHPLLGVAIVIVFVLVLVLVVVYGWNLSDTSSWLRKEFPEGMRGVVGRHDS